MANNIVQLQDKDGNDIFPIAGGFDPASIIDLFYPVGSYYETSDTTFDPNVSWGGTWVEDTTGRATIASGTGYTTGATGGSTTHQITSAELPTHTHTYDKAKTPTGAASGNTGQASGNTGSTTLTINQIPSHTHSMRYAGSTSGSTQQLWYGNPGTVNLDVTTGSTGGGQGHTHTLNNHTHTLNNHTHTISTTSTNSGNGGFANTAMSIMQPYIVVKRWHRTS